MNIMWPSESTDENGVIKRLRVMLDSLEEDMIADRPENLDKLDGASIEEIQEEDIESLAGAAKAESSEAAVKVHPQGQNKRKLAKIPEEPRSKSRRIIPIIALNKKKSASFVGFDSLKSKVDQKVLPKS